MKLLTRNLSALTALFACGISSAEIIYSNFQNITIPTTYDGIYIDVDGVNAPSTSTFTGWDFNPYLGGAYVANNTAFQPGRTTAADDMGTLKLFALDSTIDSGLLLGTGMGGSIDHLGTQFTAGVEGYFGFKLNGTNYGWMRVVFTDNASGAVIKDWAYDDAGGSLLAGGVRQEGQNILLTSSFTLGSVLINSGGATNVIKSGTGTTTTLTKINTYTGATTVSSGILQIASAGSINTSSGVTVAAGAKFVYNSGTALSIGLTLEGNGTSNRAVLGGTGAINTSVTLNNLGDTLSPGNSPGIQNYTPAQTWSSFSYDWEVNNFTGTTPGTHFDQIVIGDTLTLSGGSGSYVLNVLGLNAENVAGNVPNFSEINRSWTILTSTVTTGFDAANWTINTAGFSNADAGAWSLGQVGNDIVLSYAAIPEPSTALLGGLCLLFVLRRKRNA